GAFQSVVPSARTCLFFSLVILRTPSSPLFPYTTLFRSRILARRFFGREWRIGVVVPTHAIGALRSEEVNIRTHGFGIHSTYRMRSEEHTSELQSHLNLVCRLLLEKKKQHRPAQQTRKNI